MLVLSRKIDESITIGNHIKISILGIKGNQVKLGITAPKDVAVNRTEIYENIMKENIQAAQVPQDLDQISKILKIEEGTE